VFVAPSRTHWDLFVKMCNAIEGPLVTDAYVAALAIEHGCELITTDSDFRSVPRTALASSIKCVDAESSPVPGPVRWGGPLVGVSSFL